MVKVVAIKIEVPKALISPTKPPEAKLLYIIAAVATKMITIATQVIILIFSFRNIQLNNAPNIGEVLIITNVLEILVFCIATVKHSVLRLNIIPIITPGLPILINCWIVPRRYINNINRVIPEEKVIPRQNNIVHVSALSKRIKIASGLRIITPVVVKSMPFK